MLWITSGYELFRTLEFLGYKVLQETGAARGTNSYIYRSSKVKVSFYMEQAYYRSRTES